MRIDSHFVRYHFAYSRHASEKFLVAAATLTEDEIKRDLGGSFGGVLGTLTHIYQADQVWLHRVRGRAQAGLGGADEIQSLAELQSKWKEVFDGIEDWAAEEHDPEAVVCFRSAVLKRDCQAKLWQVILHLVNHGTYHRGQVTSMLRQLGHPAPSNDFIFYCMDHGK